MRRHAPRHCKGKYDAYHSKVKWFNNAKGYGSSSATAAATSSSFLGGPGQRFPDAEEGQRSNSNR